ncbi:hypothetical protein [Streptomyces sp. NPDC048659]|uniref:hypothetical protein n=1 Tax=Streptomyces sp. NPDC048659 TaxID=3155489 RepID=UPI00343968EE
MSSTTVPWKPPGPATVPSSWAPPSTPSRTTGPPLSCSPSSGCPPWSHSNDLYADAIAAAFLTASGRPVKVSTDQAVELVRYTANGLDIRDVATALTTSTP